MYIIMSETFIEIDSLQHLEISRETYPTNRSKIRATTFTVLTLCFFLQINADTNACIVLDRTFATLHYLMHHIFQNICNPFRETKTTVCKRRQKPTTNFSLSFLFWMWFLFCFVIVLSGSAFYLARKTTQIHSMLSPSWLLVLSNRSSWWYICHFSIRSCHRCLSVV